MLSLLRFQFHTFTFTPLCFYFHTLCTTIFLKMEFFLHLINIFPSHVWIFYGWVLFSGFTRHSHNSHDNKNIITFEQLQSSIWTSPVLQVLQDIHTVLSTTAQHNFTFGIYIGQQIHFHIWRKKYNCQFEQILLCTWSFCKIHMALFSTAQHGFSLWIYIGQLCSCWDKRHYISTFRRDIYLKLFIFMIFIMNGKTFGL